MKRRCFVFLMAFLFMSALIVAAEPSGLESENMQCNVEEIMEDPAAKSGPDVAIVPIHSVAEQAEAVLTEYSDSGISSEEISLIDTHGENVEHVAESAATGMACELDENIPDKGLGGELPADLLIASQEVSDEQAVDLDSEAETVNDLMGYMPDGTEPCQTEYLHPADVISADDLKISSSLDPIRIIRLPDGCRVEGEILFTVIIQSMSSQNLRVRAVPVFSEKAQALYMELGISLDQDAVEITVEGGGEQSLIWRFTAIAGKTVGFDPSLINAQDLVFQLRVAVEAVMP